MKGLDFTSLTHLKMNKLLIILLFAGIYSQTFAAARDIAMSSRNVFHQEADSRKSFSDRLHPLYQGKMVTTNLKSATDSAYFPDTIVFYKTQDTLREIYQYDSRGNMVAFLQQAFMDSVWGNSFLVEMDYNSRGQIVYGIYLLWMEGDWVNSERESLSFDDLGNEVTYLYEIWEDTVWITDYQSQTEYEYDSEGNILNETISRLENDQWIISRRYSYVYDQKGDLLSELYESYSDTTWIPWQRTTYTYDTAGNVKSETEEYGDGSGLNLSWRSLYTYDLNGNKLTWLQQSYWENTWSNEALIAFTYDGDGNEITYLGETWDGNSWMMSSRATSDYDSSGNYLGFISQYYEDGTWTNNHSETCTYDSHGNLILWEWLIWNSNTGEWEYWYSNNEPCVYMVNGKETWTNEAAVKMVFRWVSIKLDETIAPRASISYSESKIRTGDELEITATFNKALSAADTVKISFTGAVDLPASNMVRVNDSVYTFNYLVPKGSGDVSITLSDGTDLAGNPVDPIPKIGETFNILDLRYGDVNDDGNIQAYDAALTLQYAYGLDPLPDLDPKPWENWRDTTANVDGNEGITITDAELILQHSVGSLAQFPADVSKSAQNSDVTIELDQNDLIFKSFGNLIGLNINASNLNGILGVPHGFANGFISATNIHDTVYNIGLCTSVPSGDGEVILRIPVLNNGTVSFNLIVNTDTKTETLDITTGVHISSKRDFILYPNPFKDILTFSGSSGSTYMIEIYTQTGQLAFRKSIEGRIDQIDLGFLESGIYFMNITSTSVSKIEKFIKL